MATSLLSRTALALGALVALAGPAAAQTNVALGGTVSVISGSVNGVGLSTLTDGAFVPDAQWWQSGSVWWFGTTPVLEIDLGGAYNITGLIAQADNNDTYRVSFHSPGASFFDPAFDFSPPDWTGLRTYPNPGDNTQIAPLGYSVLADRVRFQAVSGDGAYSVSEIQLFGTSTVPEPATLALTGIGLAGLGVIARRRRA